METVPKSNVIPFKTTTGIFSSEQRKRLEDSVKPHTDKPDLAVSALEQMICVFFVEVARRVAVALGNKVAHALSGK